MTCCADDITFMGIPCKYPAAAELKTRSWVRVTASIEVRYSSVYKGRGPVLTALEITPDKEPANEVVTF